MPYATATDILTAHGPDALYVADRDGDGQVETPAVVRALDAATAEINSFLGVRYPMPLPSVDALVVQLCVDIAVYRLAQTHDRLTDEIRKRYDDAIATLKRLAKGEQMLLVPTVPGGPEPAPTPDPRPIVTNGPPRIFSRDQTRGL